MKLFSKIFIYFVASMLLAWMLPWTFRFLTARPVSAPFTLYSCVTDGFAYVETGKDKATIYKDSKGNTYTAAEFDSILPLFYYRQLMAKDRLPDTICGTPVTAATIRKGNFNVRLTTRDVNVNLPHVWMLMESIPAHVDLEDPREAFRMTDRMTIIRMADNSVDAAKSENFTKVLKEKGFVFPLLTLSGNPTTKKDHDQGYFIIDRNHQVFHVKQMKGRPYIKNTGIDPALKMKHVLITEFPGKKTLAFLTDEQNNFYALDGQYLLQKLPLSYNPQKQDMLTIGDLFNWTIKIADGNGYSLYAIDADSYQLVDSLRFNYPEQPEEKIAKAIFPFTLSFTSADDKWVEPRLADFSATALLLNLLLAVSLLIIRRKRLKEAIPYSIAVVCLGIFIYLPFLIIKK